MMHCQLQKRIDMINGSGDYRLAREGKDLFERHKRGKYESETVLGELWVRSVAPRVRQGIRRLLIVRIADIPIKKQSVVLW